MSVCCLLRAGSVKLLLQHFSKKAAMRVLKISQHSETVSVQINTGLKSLESSVKAKGISNLCAKSQVMKMTHVDTAL